MSLPVLPDFREFPNFGEFEVWIGKKKTALGNSQNHILLGNFGVYHHNPSISIHLGRLPPKYLKTTPMLTFKKIF
jgi:hypothetical protein